MEEFLMNPMVIFGIVVIILVGIVFALKSYLFSLRTESIRVIDENIDYLQAKKGEVNNVVDNLINVYVTDQKIIKELSDLKVNISINERSIEDCILLNNYVYNFINSPLIVGEDYKELRESLNNVYINMFNDSLKNERLRYNEKVNVFNTKIVAFPFGIIGTFFGVKPLRLFEDVVVKSEVKTSNSESYLSNNYKIDQSSIQSPTPQVEVDSNLFLANQNKPDEKDIVSFDSPVVNSNVSVDASLVNKEQVVVSESPIVKENHPIDLVTEPVVSEPVIINDNPIVEQNVTSEVVNNPEPIVINQDDVVANTTSGVVNSFVDDVMPSVESSITNPSDVGAVVDNKNI